jgi:hypothetical protein
MVPYAAGARARPRHRAPRGAGPAHASREARAPAEHFSNVDALRDRILALTGAAGESDDLDWKTITQGEVRALGPNQCEHHRGTRALRRAAVEISIPARAGAGVGARVPRGLCDAQRHRRGLAGTEDRRSQLLLRRAPHPFEGAYARRRREPPNRHGPPQNRMGG